MIKNTAFVYEEMEAESYLNTVAGIGIIDKRVTEKGKRRDKEQQDICDNQSGGYRCGNAAEDKKKSLEYRGAALGAGCVA